MKEVFTQESASEILRSPKDLARARIFESNTQYPFSIQKVTIDLTTARLETNPYEIKFPFRSIYVQDASDVLTNIFLKPVTRDAVQSFFKLKGNDAWNCEYPVGSAYLHWDAQSGKSVTIVFFVDSEFRSGSQISVSGGGVSINDGSAFTTSVVTLGAAAATAILAQNLSRKVATLQNLTGATYWIGGSSVSNAGANIGIAVGTGDIVKWRNTAALYGYSVAGGNLTVLEEV